MAQHITIQLIKSYAYDKDKIFSLRGGIDTIFRYAPEDAYDYFMLGGQTILSLLKENLLETDLVPFLKDFYEEFYGNDYLDQREAIIKEFSSHDRLTVDICEKIGYEMEDKFMPCFMNDAGPRPYHMIDERIDLDPTGIILYEIPLDKATFAQLANMENELIQKWKNHPLAKALKICIV